MIILRGVNLFPTQIEEIILRTAGLAPHFQLVLSTEGRMDALTVRVEARPDAGPAISFDVVVRIDGPAEVEYFRAGGILQMVLRDLLAT
jgi:aconitase A